MTTTTAVAPRTSTRKPDLAVAAAIVTVLLWASAFVGIRMIGHQYSPGAMALGRIGIGALALTPLFLRRRGSLPRGRALAMILGYGVLWFAGYTVILNWAERHLDAGTAALLVNFAPIIVAVLAGLFMGEGFSRPLLTGMLIAFGGVVIIAFWGLGGGATSNALGVALGLLTALLYATSVLLQKVALRTVDAVTATWLGCVTGAVVLLPFAPRLVHETVHASGGAIAGVVYLGIFPTAIAFSTWAYALVRTGAGKATATTLTVPALAILMSWALLGEMPTTLGLAGGALCLTGVAISRRRR